MKDKKFLALSTGFFLLFVVAMLAVTLDRPASSIIRAQTAIFDPGKSFAIVFPQISSINSKVKVSVYFRDPKGGPIVGRSVKLSTSNNSGAITPSHTLSTDGNGMALFFLESAKPGKMEITATDLSTNTNITNIPSIEFVQ